ncbi:transposable element Tcb2 transposase [Trichonephila clavipes]|nr:transposable element Tcb2 transposase [Trichonephila clavipes]
MSMMSQRSHLTDSEAWRVVGRLKKGPNSSRSSAQSAHWSVTKWDFQDLEPFFGDWKCWPRQGVFSSGGNREYRDNPAFVHESVRFGGGGVFVYGGISIDGRADLYIIRDGPLTARRYRDEILRPIVVPYAAAIGDYLILMDDNCRRHRANLVEDFLFEEGIVRREWPACSPDLNPIEHIWGALGRRVANRQPPLQTLQELEGALLEEWNRIPQLVINSLIDSMPQRCSTLLAVRGNHIPY